MAPSVLDSLKPLAELCSILEPDSVVDAGQRFKDRSIYGLLELSRISPSLSMDFYAIMYVSGITLRGEFRTVVKEAHMTRERVEDPDRRKRRSLRRLVNALVTDKMLQTQKVTYAPPTRLVGVIEHGPPQGIVCWNGVMKVKNRPKGQTLDSYSLALPKKASFVDSLLAELSRNIRLPDQVREVIKLDLKVTYRSLQILLAKNAIDADLTAKTKLESLVNLDDNSPNMIPLYFVSAAVAHPKKTIEWLRAAIQLLADDAGMTA